MRREVGGAALASAYRNEPCGGLLPAHCQMMRREQAWNRAGWSLACAQRFGDPTAGGVLAPGQPWKEKLAVFEWQCQVGDSASCLELGHVLRYGCGQKADWSRATVVFEKACAGGSARACLDLAGQAQADEPKRRFGRRAEELFDADCRNGDMVACESLAGLTPFSIYGIEGTPARRVELLTTACDGGRPSACRSLAHTLENGAGVPRDLAGAAKIYLKQCGDHDPGWGCDGLVNVAGSLEYGAHVPRDPEEAQRLYTVACERHSSVACARLRKMSGEAGDAGDTAP